MHGSQVTYRVHLQPVQYLKAYAASRAALALRTNKLLILPYLDQSTPLSVVARSWSIASNSACLVACKTAKVLVVGWEQSEALKKVSVEVCTAYIACRIRHIASRSLHLVVNNKHTPG